VRSAGAMSQAAKRRGSTWERDCAEYLRGVFPNVERAPRWGSVDKGDLVGTPGFTFEAKACKSIDLAGFVDEAVQEAANAGQPFGVALIKRRNKSVGDGYAVMRIKDFETLLGHCVRQFAHLT
jgi:hypothetical protein